MLIVQLIAGQAEEGNCASGAERHADHTALFVGVDSKAFAVRPGDSTPSERRHLSHIVRIVEPRLIFLEIDDQADATVRHQPFLLVRLRSLLEIPELLHKAGERRRGFDQQVRHDLEIVRPRDAPGQQLPAEAMKTFAAVCECSVTLEIFSIVEICSFD